MKPKFLKPLHFCSAKIIPLVFDNSLSYYEQLCAFSAKLNCIIDYVNSMSLGLTEFYEMVNEELGKYVTMTEFNEFKAYVLDLINNITIHGVGETIETGTEYTYDDVTYTAGSGSEIFNSYDTIARNQAAGDYSHAEGSATKALADNSHAEGAASVATGYAAHAEGQGIASNTYAHAENSGTATASNSHAEGTSTASNGYSHAEGLTTTASGLQSHSEGQSTTASGDSSHAEGYQSVASGAYSHAENGSIAAGDYSHAEGWHTGTNKGAIGDYSHCEGYNNYVQSARAHAEGADNTIQGIDSQ